MHGPARESQASSSRSGRELLQGPAGLCRHHYPCGYARKSMKILDASEIVCMYHSPRTAGATLPGRGACTPRVLSNHTRRCASDTVPGLDARPLQLGSAHIRTARCPHNAARLGSTWCLSASLPGRIRVLAGPGHDHQQPRVRRLPSSTCDSLHGGRWVADEAPGVAPPPGGGTGGVPRSLERPLLTVLSVRGIPRRVGRRAAGTVRAGSAPQSAP
jgi:hypothetical protein